MLLMPMHSNWC